MELVLLVEGAWIFLQLERRHLEQLLSAEVMLDSGFFLLKSACAHTHLCFEWREVKANFNGIGSFCLGLSLLNFTWCDRFVQKHHQCKSPHYEVAGVHRDRYSPVKYQWHSATPASPSREHTVMQLVCWERCHLLKKADRSTAGPIPVWGGWTPLGWEIYFLPHCKGFLVGSSTLCNKV